MVSVFPTRLDLEDISDRFAEPNEANWNFSSCSELNDDECALCEFGACNQRYVLSFGECEPIVVHRALGQA